MINLQRLEEGRGATRAYEEVPMSGQERFGLLLTRKIVELLCWACDYKEEAGLTEDSREYLDREAVGLTF